METKTHKMSDTVELLFPLEAYIKSQTVRTARTWPDQKHTIDCSLSVQQSLSLLLQTMLVQYFIKIFLIQLNAFE